MIVEVHIKEQGITSKMIFWENSLIMYVIGGELTMTTVERFMQNTWNFVAISCLYYNE